MESQMGGGSRMSRHVRQKAYVSVVTGGKRHSGGSGSRDPAAGPGGGRHKPSPGLLTTTLPDGGGKGKR